MQQSRKHHRPLHRSLFSSARSVRNRSTEVSDPTNRFVHKEKEPMRGLQKFKLLPMLGLLVLIALVVGACAPAATTTAPAADSGEAAAPASDLPAEPGRGTDGTLTLLYWQAVSIINPYQSTGTKDYHAGSLVLESLLEYDPAGNLIATLAQEVPTVENGGVSEDLTSITYKLKPGIVWADGTPLTADDFVFTWQYCATPETGCTSGNFSAVTNVEAIDAETIKITFPTPQPYPYYAFVGYLSPVIQKAQFENCVGAAAATCAEANSMPIGTGPYKVKEFRANDVVVYEVNENYRIENQPHFAEVVMKGGGDAESAARAVLETGEADYAWNLQVPPDVLGAMEERGLGTVVAAFGGNVERILINFTNPDPNLGDARSEWTEENPNPHPFLTDPAVRQALSLAIDRTIIAEQLYGAGGRATCNIVSGPELYVSTANDACLTQDIAGAQALLEGAGWVDSNGDGVREKDGVELRVLYQTSTNAVRQRTQALVQQWWGEIGVATELKNIDAGVYFGPTDNADSLSKFYTDVQMFTNGNDSPNPQAYLGGWRCVNENGVNIPNNANAWGGENIERWCNEEFDTLWNELASTADTNARIELVKQLNDMIVQANANLPLVFRASVSAHANTVAGVDLGGFETEEWNIETWHRVR
jgi:peptide/nickel transport system substrate-binding protein